MGVLYVNTGTEAAPIWTPIEAGPRGEEGPQGEPGASAGPGTVVMFAGPNIPAGWLACNGQAVLRADFPVLFGVIGTAYGAGDGSTTFLLPNLYAHFPFGGAPGSSGGANSHTHPLSSAGAAALVFSNSASPALFAQRGGSFPAWNPNFQGNASAATTSLGAGQTIGTPLMGATDVGSSMPPYTTVWFIIKT